MEKFISCDWGTTSFRLRLVEIVDAKIIAEENSDNGIAKVFDLWQQRGEPEHMRFSFYRKVVSRYIDAIKKKSNFPLDGFPVVISGMACSTLGMIDLPYTEVPFSADGSDLVTKIVVADKDFEHDIIFISGARTESDAMRGEETQLAGCFNDQEEQLFVFPGTHSKHVIVKNTKAVDIKTYMTGEFFELLSAKSILAPSVEKNADMSNEKSRKAFEAGIDESLHSNLLHGSFKVRTNNLFAKLAKTENYHYLSGLLIGSEIKEIAEGGQDITLVSNSYLRSHYEVACNRLLDKSSRLNIQNADEAMVRGQLKVLGRVLKEKRFSDVR